MTCQADVRQYPSIWDLELFPLFDAERLGHSPARENILGFRMVCLIDCDVQQSQQDPANLREVNRQIKC